MYDLKSIDLTSGRRFEKASNDALKNSYDDRGIHRLKKGEIPHNSNIVLSYENTNNTTWFVNTTTQLSTIINTNNFNDFNIDIDSIIRWTNISNITTTNTSSLYIYTDDYTMYNNYHTINNCKDDNNPIENRITLDPFEVGEIIVNGREYVYKLKCNESFEYISPFADNKRSITNRLYLNDDYNRMDYKESDIIDRMDDNAHNKHDLYNIRDDISILKEKAPFIKRVYVTNGGRSFDNKDLEFDLILAKEHFDDYLSMSNL